MPLRSVRKCLRQGLQMVNENRPPESTVNVPATSGPMPLIFADAVANIQYGPFTSKVFLATQPTPNQFVTTACVVLPTVALIHLAKMLSEQLNDVGMKAHFELHYAELIRSMRGDTKESLPNVAPTSAT
jgi:hypothetical protein